jgi:hypothetical protein
MTATQERLDTRFEFIEPVDIDEAKERLTAVLNNKLDIEAQLANRDHRNPDGTRMDGVEYWQWRSRAIWAKRFREKEIAALKAWIKAAHLRGEGIQGPVVPDDEYVRLLYGLYRMTRFVEGERVPWDAYAPDEQWLLNAAQTRLKTFGVSDGELGI